LEVYLFEIRHILLCVRILRTIGSANVQKRLHPPRQFKGGLATVGD
jgi:hypothetical protein